MIISTLEVWTRIWMNKIKNFWSNIIFTSPWLIGKKKMKSELGERYESPKQLKFFFKNYIIGNGYFAKSDYKRLLVLCGKESDESK